MASKLKPQEICISNSFHPNKLIARFCVPDPCRPAAYENAVIQDIWWTKGASYVNAQISNFQLITEMRMGRTATFNPRFLDPGTTESRRFYILPNAKLYVSAYPEGSRVSNDYCVDDFKFHDKIVSYFTTISLFLLTDWMFRRKRLWSA